MERYELSLWSNDDAENIGKIHSIACQIKSVSKKVGCHEIRKEQAQIIIDNSIDVINYWTGHTFVGEKKEKRVKKAFQAFFIALYDLVSKCRESEIQVIRECADMILFQGTVYRYLGHNTPENCSVKVEPIYNDIYVSWSKEQDSHYLLSKLYGSVTSLVATIREPYYGIDLEGIEKAMSVLIGVEYSLSKGTEREVVFPTIADCITDIEYIPYKSEEDEA